MSMNMDAKALTETFVGPELRDGTPRDEPRHAEKPPVFDARSSARETLRRYPIVMAKLAE